VSTLVTGAFDTVPRRLRVAMVAPPWYELPPTGYGGIELICAALVDALVARGHHVTLFGAGRRTGTAAEFVSTLPHPQYLRLGEAMPTLLHAARVNRLLSEGRFDVIHDHSVSGALNAPQREAPTVVTVHGPADTELGDFYAALGESVNLVAISDSQRRRRPGMPWAATVHNAIDPDWFVPATKPDGPVL
jgi:glycosyltransferase involved in cell wall biosynthesis